ncbi:hypothetical protein [Desulfuromonas sp. TF]|uniref:hypothetical protein n=1 Tax=Desulfuromonas sp. TF TaxID=1232410 RepID=UPI0004268B45|nr:hypothetical protein [Desulfuromonas sp. TF]
MAIDWSKVFEVFGSGVIGVFTVMFLLMLLTQLSTKIIDLIEKNWNKDEQPEPKSQAALAKEKP